MVPRKKHPPGLRCSGAYAEEGIRAEPVDPSFLLLLLLLISFLFFFFSPSLFIFFYPQEEKTACVQRVHLPFRDAYCTLDDAIYRSWALAGPVCVVLACVHNSTDECDARLISPGTKRSDPKRIFKNDGLVFIIVHSLIGSRLIGCSIVQLSGRDFCTLFCTLLNIFLSRSEEDRVFVF